MLEKYFESLKDQINYIRDKLCILVEKNHHLQSIYHGPDPVLKASAAF